MGKVMARIKRFLMALQTGWSIAGITLLLLLFLEAGLRLTFALRDRLSAAEQPDHRILAEGYGGATWPIEHYRESNRSKSAGSPMSTSGPSHSTARPSPSDQTACEPRGSLPRHRGQAPGRTRSRYSSWAARRSGVSARGTTRQSLRCYARKLHERGLNVEIKNLAELGYVSTQELIGLIRELQEGYRPDVVIFYDGVNDTTSALLSGEAGLTTNEINRRREFNLLQSPRRLAGILAEKLLVESGSYRLARALRSRLGQRTATSDLEPLRGFDAPPGCRSWPIGMPPTSKSLETLARGYGFRPLFFWQPTIFNKTRAHRRRAG